MKKVILLLVAIILLIINGLSAFEYIKLDKLQNKYLSVIMLMFILIMIFYKKPKTF